MQTRPAPIARMLTFLSVGVICGLLADPHAPVFLFSYKLQPVLMFGLALTGLLGAHLWRRPARSRMQIIAVCLSPLAFYAAFMLALLLFVFGVSEANLGGGLLMLTKIIEFPQPHMMLDDLRAALTLRNLLEAVSLTILTGVLATATLTFCLRPLLRPGAARGPILTGIPIGLLILISTLAQQWQEALSQSSESPFFFSAFMTTALFYASSFGLFAAALAWGLPAPSTQLSSAPDISA